MSNEINALNAYVNEMSSSVNVCVVLADRIAIADSFITGR